MKKNILWELFNKTGNINYYNLLKRIRSDEENERQNNESNTSTSNNNSNNMYSNNK